MSDVEALGMKQRDWKNYVQHITDNEQSIRKTKVAIITRTPLIRLSSVLCIPTTGVFKYLSIVTNLPIE
jgi:hypothetical protein